MSCALNWNILHFIRLTRLKTWSLARGDILQDCGIFGWHSFGRNRSLRVGLEVVGPATWSCFSTTPFFLTHKSSSILLSSSNPHHCAQAAYHSQSVPGNFTLHGVLCSTSSFGISLHTPPGTHGLSNQSWAKDSILIWSLFLCPLSDHIIPYNWLSFES